MEEKMIVLDVGVETEEVAANMTCCQGRPIAASTASGIEER
jgi:hypothetical protein